MGEVYLSPEQWWQKTLATFQYRTVIIHISNVILTVCNSWIVDSIFLHGLFVKGLSTTVPSPQAFQGTSDRVREAYFGAVFAEEWKSLPKDLKSWSFNCDSSGNGGGGVEISFDKIGIFAKEKTLLGKKGRKGNLCHKR